MGSRRGAGVENGKESAIDMPSFVSSIGAPGNNMERSRISDFGIFKQSMGFRAEDVADLSRYPLFDPKSGGQTFTSDPMHFSSFTKQLASTDITPMAAPAGSVTLPQQKVQQSSLALPGSRFDSWGETTMAAASPSTDTSTDIDTDDKNQQFEHGQPATIAASDSSDRSKDKRSDQKTLRRLAQNREAARKSRLRKKALGPVNMLSANELLRWQRHSNPKTVVYIRDYLNLNKEGSPFRESSQSESSRDLLWEYLRTGCVSMTYDPCQKKKAYVQQLESSRVKLAQMEQEFQRARQQGIFISSSGDQTHAMSGNGALAFDIEYGRWLEDHNRHINELRTAVNSHAGDADLRIIVDGIMAHHTEIFKLKSTAAKADVFHMLSGMWTTPAERCFLWLGGFRSSELLKILANQLEPLTEQQLVGICNLQQSSQQAEDALSQGMEALQQSLAETLASGSSGSSGNVANYMGQMAMAMGKLGTLENFLCQADNLRQQTLQQMHRILTTRQAARALLAIHDYFSRLRALSSLWLARPKE